MGNAPHAELGKKERWQAIRSGRCHESLFYQIVTLMLVSEAWWGEQVRGVWAQRLPLPPTTTRAFVLENGCFLLGKCLTASTVVSPRPNHRQAAKACCWVGKDGPVWPRPFGHACLQHTTSSKLDGRVSKKRPSPHPVAAIPKIGKRGLRSADF